MSLRIPSIPSVASAQLTRRELIRAGALATAGLVAPGLARSADPPGPVSARGTPHYFVFYYMLGGWDLALLTEPLLKGENAHLPFDPGEVFEAGGHAFGPAMVPLVPWLDRTAVLRGIRMEALNHPQARFMLATGGFKPPGPVRRPSMQTLIAEQLGAAYPLPNLSSDGIRPTVFLGDLPERNKPLRIGDVDELRRLNAQEGASARYRERIAQAISERDRRMVGRSRVPLVAEFARYAEMARALGASDYARRVERAELPGFTPRRFVSYGNRWGRQAHLAIEAVKQDLAPVVSVGSGEFDSHTEREYEGHRRSVERGIETVACICEGLERHALGPDETLLDRTTIVVASEFGREPWINELGGKHHWPTNAMLLIGKGVRKSPAGSGPFVFGEADDQLYPVPIDPATGGHGAGAEELGIGHALASVLQIAGIDPTLHLEEQAIPALVG